MKKCLCLLLALLTLTGCAWISTGDATLPPDTKVAPETTLPVTTAVPETTVPETTLPATTVPETTAAETDPVLDLLSAMTTEEKVGQILLARCPTENAATDIQTYHLGGYLLFGRDFQNETVDSVTATIAAYQSAATIPMLIAVDEEGGTVNRVSRYTAFRSEPFASPRALYAQGGLEAILETEAEKCQLLSSLGINVNLGPVCDIATDPSAFMYARSLGQDPQTTADFVAAVVSLMSREGIGCAPKHFPGYGNNTDTHTGIAVDNRSLDDLEACDLIPFAAGIDAGCDAILVSHVYVTVLDTEYPASLSPAVHEYLRDVMGFTGVILTDDLSMEAITDLYGAGEAAVLAVLAGNDLLCVTDYAAAYEAILVAVEDGRVPTETLDAAVEHVLRWKTTLGLI